MNSRSAALSALIAGVVIGFLGNLPAVNLINCLLCVWVWAGGALAVLLYRRFQGGHPGLSAAQGAGLGAMAGLVGAVWGTVVYLATSAISVPIFNSLWRALQIGGQSPFQTGSSADYVSQTLIFLVIDVVLYTLFGALSGMITANLTKERPAGVAAAA